MRLRLEAKTLRTLFYSLWDLMVWSSWPAERRGMRAMEGEKIRSGHYEKDRG